MFCPNCGKENADDALFCEECGTPLQDMPGDTSAAAEAPEVPAETPAASLPMKPPVQGGTGGYDPNTGEWNPNLNVQQYQSAPKKSVKVPVIIGCVAAAVVAVVLIAVLAGVLKGGKGKSSDVHQIAYMRDGKYYFVKDITKGKPEGAELLELKGTDLGDEYSSTNQLLGGFYGSGQYFYFYSRVDQDDSEGTLVRIPVSKINGNPDANERNVEEIATHVNPLQVQILDNDTVLSIRDEELSFFNGKKTVELADDVETVIPSSDNKSIVYLGDRRKKDGSMTLYAMPLREGAVPVEIDDGVTNIWSKNADYVVYGKTDDKDEGTYEIYTFDGKNAVAVAEEVRDVYLDPDSDSKAFYFSSNDPIQADAYDFVKDPYEKEDKDLSEPVMKNFLQGVSMTEALSQYYRKQLTERFRGDLTDFIRSYGYDKGDGIYEVYNSDMDRYYYFNTADQSWNTYDSDSYDKAREDYYAVKSRIDLREALKKTEITVDRLLLSRYDNGKLNVITDNAAFVRSYRDGVLIYTELNDVVDEGVVSIDDISYAEEVSYLISDGDSTDYRYSIGGGKPAELSLGGRIADVRTMDEGNSLLFEIVPLKEEDEEDEEEEENEFYGHSLVKYSIKGSKLQEEALVAEEALLAAATGDTVYYYQDVEDGEGDLYLWKNNNEKRIAKHVMAQGTRYAGNDGYYLIPTDKSSDVSFEMTLYDGNGDKVDKVDEDIQSYAYFMHDRILYIKDDALYLYNGRDSVRIDKKVNAFWYNGILGATYLGSPSFY